MRPFLRPCRRSRVEGVRGGEGVGLQRALRRWRRPGPGRATGAGVLGCRAAECVGSPGEVVQGRAEAAGIGLAWVGRSPAAPGGEPRTLPSPGLFGPPPSTTRSKRLGRPGLRRVLDVHGPDTGELPGRRGRRGSSGGRPARPRCPRERYRRQRAGRLLAFRPGPVRVRVGRLAIRLRRTRPREGPEAPTYTYPGTAACPAEGPAPAHTAENPQVTGGVIPLTPPLRCSGRRMPGTPAGHCVPPPLPP